MGVDDGGLVVAVAVLVVLGDGEVILRVGVDVGERDVVTVLQDEADAFVGPLRFGVAAGGDGGGGL